MLAAQRRSLILNQLKTEGKVVVSQLCGLYNVSDETIRRDLDRLCRDGLAVKSYGGATLNEPDLPFNIRKKHNTAEKRKIAELIEALVNDGERIILDASTTAVFAAKMLKNKKDMTVITNSIEVMLELSDRPDIHVISTGGQLHGESLSLTGQQAVSGLSYFYADKLIFSCKGLDISRGIFDSNDDFAQVKRAMLKTAKVKILAVDLSKFDRPAFSKIAGTGEVDIVVSDGRPGDMWVEHFFSQNVQLLC
jgi:DeoR/GlpR family transcriptional regulator of sugar metabolism